MFKLKFAHMYDNNIFKEYNLKPVVEDYFVVQNNLFCIADGVTRDSIYGDVIPYPKNREEVEYWVKVYPNPSGAYESAKICAEAFVKYISKYKAEEITENIIEKAVKQANEDIWKINKERKIDYLANDLFGCVAVGGCIVDNNLYCFSIGDCHITLLDENFNVKFNTINNHKQFENYLENVYCKEQPYDWSKPEYRVMVRKDYRNKPEMKYNGKEVSFGVLTGEKEAEHYIDVYKIDLSEVKYICAYSDGCEPFFEEKELMKDIVINPENLKNEGKERTLIIYEKIS